MRSLKPDLEDTFVFGGTLLVSVGLGFLWYFAIFLDAQRVGPGRRYIVDGGASSHAVDLDADSGDRCDCPDYRWRGNLCKHVLIARLHQADAEVILALRELVSAE